jgi:hypothetical protein
MDKTEAMMYLNIWGAEEIYDEQPQTEPHKEREQEPEKNPLIRHLQNILAGNKNENDKEEK